MKPKLLEGKTNATYVPHGEQVFNVQLTLRALKIAELEVHHQPTLKKGAAIGAGAGAGVGTVGGAAAGAVAGSVVPGIGTAIGAMVGGIIGLFTGGAAAAGVGFAAGAGIAAAVDEGDTITLTAEEIFKEGDNYAEHKKKEGYITCVINYPYVANFDIATAEDI